MVLANTGDAIRPFLLDAYGGLYMDVDVECFDSAAAMIDGFDLVSSFPCWYALQKVTATSTCTTSVSPSCCTSP